MESYNVFSVFWYPHGTSVDGVLERKCHTPDSGVAAVAPSRFHRIQYADIFNLALTSKEESHTLPRLFTASIKLMLLTGQHTLSSLTTSVLSTRLLHNMEMVLAKKQISALSDLNVCNSVN
jgi:hypothetical protein